MLDGVTLGLGRRCASGLVLVREKRSPVPVAEVAEQEGRNMIAHPGDAVFAAATLPAVIDVIARLAAATASRLGRVPRSRRRVPRTFGRGVRGGCFGRAGAAVPASVIGPAAVGASITRGGGQDLVG